jgi:hypothetical protein
LAAGWTDAVATPFNFCVIRLTPARVISLYSCRIADVFHFVPWRPRMAKNIVVNLQGKLPNELAEDDPEMMRLWGEIHSAWDDIERLLYVAFDAMLSDAMLSEETTFATQAIFYSQTSHAARRTMVESLAKYALLNRPQTAKKLKNAIKRVKARAGDRHNLIHGTWGVGIDLAANEAGPQRIALGADIIPDPNSFYSRRRLIDVRNSMRDTANALREAIEPIETAKRAKAIELSRRHMDKARLLEEPSPS